MCVWQRKLDAREYASAQAFGVDVRLVFTNCKTYNQDGSQYYTLADTLQKVKRGCSGGACFFRVVKMVTWRLTARARPVLRAEVREDRGL